MAPALRARAPVRPRREADAGSQQDLALVEQSRGRGVEDQLVAKAVLEVDERHLCSAAADEVVVDPRVMDAGDQGQSPVERAPQPGRHQAVLEVLPDRGEGNLGVEVPIGRCGRLGRRDRRRGRGGVGVGVGDVLAHRGSRARQRGEPGACAGEIFDRAREQGSRATRQREHLPARERRAPSEREQVGVGRRAGVGLLRSDLGAAVGAPGHGVGAGGELQRQDPRVRKRRAARALPAAGDDPLDRGHPAAGGALCADRHPRRRLSLRLDVEVLVVARE